MSAPPSVLVFGDSLSFYGPDGGHAANDARLWHNVAARELGGHADLIARIGWTARDVWWSLIDDPRVWAELQDADVVVLAVGSMDSLPSPLPTFLRTGLPYLRPDALRRTVRRAYRAAQPVLCRTLPGWPCVLPPRLTVDYLRTMVRALRTLRPTLPIVGWLPSVHRAPSYGYRHPGQVRTAKAMTAWARSEQVPLLDLPSVVGSHVLGGHGNPDGMHWGWEGHVAVGQEMSRIITKLLASRGSNPVEGIVGAVG